MVQIPVPNILKNITWLYVVEYKLYHVDAERVYFLFAKEYGPHPSKLKRKNCDETVFYGQHDFSMGHFPE